MRSRLACALVLVAYAATGAAAPARAADPDRKPPAPSECVKTRTEARYSGYGYDHIVHVTNGCPGAMRCAVTTSANPETTTITVARGKTESVVTYRGSPAREFTAHVACQPAP